MDTGTRALLMIVGALLFLGLLWTSFVEHSAAGLLTPAALAGVMFGYGLRKDPSP